MESVCHERKARGWVSASRDLHYISPARLFTGPQTITHLLPRGEWPVILQHVLCCISIIYRQSLPFCRLATPYPPPPTHTSSSSSSVTSTLSQGHVYPGLLSRCFSLSSQTHTLLHDAVVLCAPLAIYIGDGREDAGVQVIHAGSVNPHPDPHTPASPSAPAVKGPWSTF